MRAPTNSYTDKVKFTRSAVSSKAINRPMVKRGGIRL